MEQDMHTKADGARAAGASDMLWDGLGLTPGALMKAKVLESSVYLTRKCNLRCQYCKIVKTTLPEELTIDQWMEAMDVLESLGVRFVNIAGGEPTVLRGLGRLITHLNDNTRMVYSVVSNSMFDDAKLKEMADAGLMAYVASIDVIDGDGGGGSGLHDLKKSSAGMAMLERLRAMAVPHLCANIVISARNLNAVTRVARYLGDAGYMVNLCPVIWGRGDKWEEVEDADISYRLTEAHRGRLEEIAGELIEMKRAGAPIVPTESYLEGLSRYAAALDWKCCSEKEPGRPPRLTIDADGSLMTCINMRGAVAEKYNIFDLRGGKAYGEFALDWWRDARECLGCYWSTMVTASERMGMVEKFKKEAARGDGTQG